MKFSYYWSLSIGGKVLLDDNTNALTKDWEEVVWICYGYEKKKGPPCKSVLVLKVDMSHDQQEDNVKGSKWHTSPCPEASIWGFKQ